MIYERTHTGEKHYGYFLCNNMFAQNQDLEKHERTHTGEKPYTYSYCDKKFAENQNMKMHERINISKKTFWIYCDKTCTQKGYYKETWKNSYR